MNSITIKDIAKLSGCSVSTVSRALNNHRDIKPETKKKIQEIIAEYGYVPNNSARNLKRKDSNTIALIVKGISNPFFQYMYTLFDNNEAFRHYSLMLHQAAENEDEVLCAIEAEKEKKACGIIFLGGLFDEKKRQHLKSLSAPYILCTAEMSGKVDKMSYSSVGINDELESYLIVKYLIGLGHRRIAIIAGKREDIGIGLLRYNGYCRALKEAGIGIDMNLVWFMEDDIPEYTPENGYAVAQKINRSGVDFSALYVISDNTAYGACKAFLDSGCRIPEDYSIASFDGLKMSRYYHPSLTTMRQPCEDIVDAVAAQLVGLIEQRVEHRQMIYPAKLIVGQSTAEYNEY